MSRDVGEERRLYQNVRKYDKIAAQFEDLIEMMNSQTRPVKRRKNSSPNGSTGQKTEEHVFVQTITRFLNELKTNPIEPEQSSIIQGEDGKL